MLEKGGLWFVEARRQPRGMVASRVEGWPELAPEESRQSVLQLQPPYGAGARGMTWTVERKVPYLTCSLPKRKVCSSFSCPPAACRPLTGVHLCDAAAHQLGRRSLFRKIRVLITWLACLSRYSSNFAELADLTIPVEGGRTLGSRISWCCWRFQLLVSSTKSYLSTS